MMDNPIKLSKVSVRNEILEKIQECREIYQGKHIDNQLMHEIKIKLNHFLLEHVATGDIKTEKWDNDIVFVEQVEGMPSQINISFAKWLEDWLDGPDEEI